MTDYRGPLGFPRLTNIGPLVTDGGRQRITLSTSGKVEHPDGLAHLEQGDYVEVIRLPKDGDMDIKELGGTGPATVTEEEFRERVNIITY